MDDTFTLGNRVVYADRQWLVDDEGLLADNGERLSYEGLDFSRIAAADRTCTWPVTKGGPSSGGGYDRLNTTRTEQCGKALADGSHVYCERHLALDAEKTRQAQWKSHGKYHRDQPKKGCPFCEKTSTKSPWEDRLAQNVRNAIDDYVYRRNMVEGKIDRGDPTATPEAITTTHGTLAGQLARIEFLKKDLRKFAPEHPFLDEDPEEYFEEPLDVAMQNRGSTRSFRPPRKEAMPRDQGLIDRLTFEHSPDEKWGDHVLKVFDDPKKVDYSFFNMAPGLIEGTGHPPDRERGQVGEIRWDPPMGRRVPRVNGLYVHPDYWHKGVATELWNRAREIVPGLKHDTDFSTPGEAWMRSLPEGEQAKHNYRSRGGWVGHLASRLVNCGMHGPTDQCYVSRAGKHVDSSRCMCFSTPSPDCPAHGEGLRKVEPKTSGWEDEWLAPSF